MPGKYTETEEDLWRAIAHLAKEVEGLKGNWYLALSILLLVFCVTQC